MRTRIPDVPSLRWHYEREVGYMHAPGSHLAGSYAGMLGSLGISSTPRRTDR